MSRRFFGLLLVALLACWMAGIFWMAVTDNPEHPVASKLFLGASAGLMLFILGVLTYSVLTYP